MLEFESGVAKDKIICGLPFFGRFWKERDAVSGIGLTASDVKSLHSIKKTPFGVFLI